ncbi:MAG: T3SS effector HopA1 family protein [Saprospiraceae bacterium]|nr:T3SS effector HopA1 family protein [Saprospiraceae bacterium]
MNPSTDPIESISRFVSVVDDHSFTVFDRQVHVAYQQPYHKWDKPIHHFGMNTGEENQLKANLISQLSSVIYGAFYIKGKVSAQGMKDWEHSAHKYINGGDEAFVEELSRYNRSTDHLDQFWRVYAIDQQGNTFVEKNGDVRPLQLDAFTYANPAETSLQINSMVHIKQPKEHRNVQPVFYYVNSAELMPVGEEIGRFYWNLEPDGAKHLVEQVSEVFNRYRVPFMFKCTNHPDLYTRTDGAVLYIMRRQYRVVTRLLRLIVPKVKPFLKEETPLFTRKITGGLSYAEDPGMNQSFGMSRAQLIAKGIVDAYYARHNNRTAQYKEILKAFKENGLDTRHPYLRPNSHWTYDFNFL